MAKNQVKISSQLQKVLNSIKKANFSEDLIPEKYQYNQNVIDKERRLKLRVIDEVGFDIIKNNFYVYDVIYENSYPRETCTYFEKFSDFYKFVNGNIYENNCYYKFKFNDSIVKKYKIDLNKINYNYILKEENNDESISNDSDINSYQLKELLNKLLSSKSSKEFKRNYDYVINKKLSCEIFKEDYICYFFNRIIEKKKNNYFNYIIDLINDHRLLYENVCINLLCYYYGAENVIDKIEVYNKKNKSSTESRRKSRINEFVKPLTENRLKVETNKYYNSFVNLFVIEENHYDPKNASSYASVNVNKYFYTFKEFVKYLNNDLSDCDLLDWEVNEKIDFSKYKKNKNTVLPKKYEINKTEIRKYYINNHFYIESTLKDKKGEEIDCESKSFNLFSKYVAYLNYDLSNGDFLICDGMNNIDEFDDINFDNCLLPPGFYNRVFNKDDSIKYPIEEKVNYDVEDYNKNYPVLAERDIEIYEDRDWKSKKFYYVSDIHLEHQIKNNKCKSNTEVQYLLRKIAMSLCESTEFSGIPVICGDIASEFELFKDFIKHLKIVFGSRKILFILGNHELWHFNDYTVNEIVSIYKKIMPDNFIILQNSLYLLCDNGDKYITESELENYDENKLKDILRDSRCSIFGGIGFSGLNESFNSKNGIYRNTISRKQEILESKKISNIFRKLDKLINRNFIIITHMPINDWYKDEFETNGRILISGHNHRNYYYNDGSYVIYSDNQIGYKNTNVTFKRFKLDGKYDWFYDYTDGIYEISKNDYIDFYRGINRTLSFNRDVKNIYMIKRDGYYCFIIKNEKNKLLMLDGGVLRKLNVQDINYYYNNILNQIKLIDKVFYVYLEKQKQISNAIKKIGGSGKIHGCIIDIDYFNHIYFNPDGTVTPYFALNTVFKVVAPNIVTLLKKNCPELYSNYCKLIETNKNFDLININKFSITKNMQLYLDTDIYKMSRFFTKIQKLDDKLLTIWDDDANPKISYDTNNVIE